MFYSSSSNGFYDTAIHGGNIPADAVEISTEEHSALIEGQAQGKRIVPDADGRPTLQDPPPPTAEQIMSRLEVRVQLWLDEQARALGYDDIKSAVTYAEESVVPQFQQEGQALRQLRSLVWVRCYEILNAVQAGQRPIPTEAELIAELEALKPPAQPVPQQVTRAQGKVVLIQMGLWEQVLDFVAAIQDPVQRAIAEVALNDTQNWERTSPFLNQAAQALGMSDEQLDDIFRAAAQVRL